VQSGALEVEDEREGDRELLIAWCRHLISPSVR
jgi:hypothetical protein